MIIVFAFDRLGGMSEDCGGAENEDGDTGDGEIDDESVLLRSISASVGSDPSDFTFGTTVCDVSVSAEDERTCGEVDGDSVSLVFVAESGASGGDAAAESADVLTGFLVSLFGSCSIILMPINYLL